MADNIVKIYSSLGLKTTSGNGCIKCLLKNKANDATFLQICVPREEDTIFETGIVSEGLELTLEEVNKLNSNIAMGNYMFDPASNKISFKSTVFVEHGSISKSTMKRHIVLGFMMMNELLKSHSETDKGDSGKKDEKKIGRNNDYLSMYA